MIFPSPSVSRWLDRRTGAALLAAATSFTTAAAQTVSEDGRILIPRIKLAANVEFPTEVLRPNSQRLHDRVVTSLVTHAPGHVVELLYDARESAQIRDPLSGRIVWADKSKLGTTPPTGPEAGRGRPDDAPYFRPYLIDTRRPIHFPSRRHEGRFFGETTIPAGEKVRITGEDGPYLRAETRDLAGWVKMTALEHHTDRPLTAIANVPTPLENDAPAHQAPPAVENPAVPVSIPFQTSNSHNYVELVALTITAEVLGRQKYPMPGQKGGFWSTEVSPVDLALVWGPFVRSGVIRARMGYRSATFSFGHPLATIYSGNFHMYVDDPEIRRQLVAVRVGDIVRLEGALIRLEHPRGKANPGESTITGAYCYTMLCRSVEKVPDNVTAHR